MSADRNCTPNFKILYEQSDSDRDIPQNIWNGYLKKFKDRYLLERDELGIWQIRLKQNLGCIQPYSIVKEQLVAILSFRSPQHKTFFKKSS